VVVVDSYQRAGGVGPCLHSVLKILFLSLEVSHLLVSFFRLFACYFTAVSRTPLLPRLRVSFSEGQLSSCSALLFSKEKQTRHLTSQAKSSSTSRYYERRHDIYAEKYLKRVV